MEQNALLPVGWQAPFPARGPGMLMRPRPHQPWSARNDAGARQWGSAPQSRPPRPHKRVAPVWRRMQDGFTLRAPVADSSFRSSLESLPWPAGTAGVPSPLPRGAEGHPALWGGHSRVSSKGSGGWLVPGLVGREVVVRATGCPVSAARWVCQAHEEAPGLGARGWPETRLPEAPADGWPGGCPGAGRGWFP